MKEDAAARAGALVHHCRVAALGTLHEGAPLVSMTPFAILPEPFALVVLVSGLSAHTRDMLADPRVSLLVMSPERVGEPVHALARLSLQGDARVLDPDGVDYLAARTAYLARFADMAGLFDLADFRLFAIRPLAVRVVAGFAQANSISPEALAHAFAAFQ